MIYKYIYALHVLMPSSTDVINNEIDIVIIYQVNHQLTMCENSLSQGAVDSSNCYLPIDEATRSQLSAVRLY